MLHEHPINEGLTGLPLFFWHLDSGSTLRCGPLLRGMHAPRKHALDVPPPSLDEVEQAPSGKCHASVMPACL